MAKKRIPAADLGAAPIGGDLSASLAALHEAAESLAASTARMTERTQQMHGLVAGTRGAQPEAPETASASSTRRPEPDEEARRFYERLEQTGQLIDVNEQTDLSALPPGVTHVRRADGTVQRIGFSASPYAKG